MPVISDTAYPRQPGPRLALLVLLKAFQRLGYAVRLRDVPPAIHTVVGMTRALDSVTSDGHGAAIIPEALAGTSPYLNEHLNRFGSHELDLSKPPAPLPFELPPQRQPARQTATACV